MKATAQQLGGVLRDCSRLSGFLFYGEDTGLIRERSSAAVHAGAGSFPLVFCETVLGREAHKLLPEAAVSEPLGGGRRIVRVQEAGDALVPALETMMKRPARALLVLEAGSLTPRSKLRSFAERQDRWVAVPCYAESGRTAAVEIEAALRRNNLQADPDAVAFLAGELSGDSARRKAEIEKLVLYAADIGAVTMDMARASCVSSAEANAAMAVSAALSGRVEATDALLAALEREGITGPGLLAVMSGQVHRLLRIRSHIEAGRSVEEALRGLQPPVFPSQMAAAARDAERWTAGGLEGVLRALREADRACKRAGSADFAIAARLLLSVAARRAPNASAAVP